MDEVPPANSFRPDQAIHRSKEDLLVVFFCPDSQSSKASKHCKMRVIRTCDRIPSGQTPRARPINSNTNSNSNSRVPVIVILVVKVTVIVIVES